METVDRVPCSATVWGSRGWNHRCSNKAKVQHQGKSYCAQHDPRAEEKRRKEREAKWDQKCAKEKQIQRKAAALLKRLGVQGAAEYHWKRGYVEAVVVSFSEVEKLLAVIDDLRGEKAADIQRGRLNDTEGVV